MSQRRHRRLRAPQDDGAVLVDPPLAELAELIERNRVIAKQFDQLSGLPPRLRALARMTLLVRADENKTDAQLEAEAEHPIIVTGHQPELFHPGVWFKNFLSSSLAHRLIGWAVNLVIDNDEIRSPAIRVPMKLGNIAEIDNVPFDDAESPIPWERRYILNFDRFRGFAAEVHRAFDSLAINHAEFRGGIILDQFWEYATKDMESQIKQSLELDEQLSREPYPIANLSRTLSHARVRLEHDLGLSLHDFPVRRLGFDNTFCTFAGILIQRHRDLHSIHNAALAEYRAANHIRSHSHPVPALAVADDWYEVPFWVWRSPDKQRRRVFVRSANGQFQLTDRHNVLIDLPSEVSEYCFTFINHQIHLRPRALITTMYARLVLSDLFIHGIGGAKYDELTDLIIRRFFGIEPPAYMTATATFRLPIERPEVSIEDVRKSAQRLRELHYRPESFLRDDHVKSDVELSAKLAALTDEKREYLAAHDLRRCSQDVFDHLDRLNRAMRDLLRPVEEEVRARHVELVALAKQSQLLGSRDFSFVLFPSEKLPARLLDLSKGVA